MGFHEDLKQSFGNFKEVYIDPLDTGKQDKLTEGAHIKIETTYEFTDITSSSDIVVDSSALPVSGTADIFYICENNNDVYTWDEDNSEYVKSTTLSAQFVATKPTTGQNVNKLYVLTGDNSVWSCAAVPNTISADYETEIASLTTVNSTQTSQIGSLSAENSTQTSEISSLASLTSTHTSELTSLSTSASELQSEYAVLSSEVADKQDSLTAGAGISISNNVISANAGISLTVVSTLPTTDISTTTIYLIAKTTAETNDIYDEYVYVNNAWEHIGSTQIDLTNYYTKTETDGLLANKQATINNADGNADVLVNAQNRLVANWSQIESAQTKFFSSANLLALPSGDIEISADVSYAFRYGKLCLSIGTVGADGQEISLRQLKLPVGKYHFLLFASTGTNVLPSVAPEYDPFEQDWWEYPTIEFNPQSGSSSDSDHILVQERECDVEILHDGINYNVSLWLPENFQNSSYTELQLYFVRNTGSSGDLSNYYTKTQIDSMSTVQSTTNSTFTSELTSLSQSASEIASVASSLSTENSTQTSELASLSTATSELASETEEMSSEIDTKQPMLTAGQNITIQDNVISASGGGGAGSIGWEMVFPSQGGE